MLWKQALKQAVSSMCAVVVTNLVDSGTPIFSWPWFRHMLIGMFFLTLLNEARYWKQWADGPDSPQNGQGGNTMKGIGSKTVGMLVVVALLAFGVAGCKQQPKVVAALNVVGQLFTITHDDLPALQVAGILTAPDVTAADNWISAGQTLLGQAQTCVGNLGQGGSGSQLATCVSAFATGLVSPQEQAQLRIISPQAQKKVTLYVTAVVLAVNFAAQIVNAIQVQTPPVGSAPSADIQPTREDLHELAARINLSPAYGY